jgi:VIT1/CCC1 family predicted Fe2+/Mn2+ transporter
MPDEEFAELVALYEAKGLLARTAEQVAAELTANDPLAAHLDAELHIDPQDMPSPAQASRRLRNLIHRRRGAPPHCHPAATAGLAGIGHDRPVLIALAITGAVSARLSRANARRAVLRLVIGGAIGLAVTYAIGSAFGTALG